MIAMLLLFSIAGFAKPPQDIVYVNGEKFYVHKVANGETIYSLSKMYDVDEETIIKYNKSTQLGLKAQDILKIPVEEQKADKRSNRKLRRTFDMHNVAKGETLYAISRRYEIPISTIIEDNNSLDPIHLKLGQRILIRKKKIGTGDEMDARDEWSEYHKDLNSVAEHGEAYHLVVAGETFYSISRRFKITEQELSRINGGLKAVDLKVGAIIKVPELAPTEVVNQEVVEVVVESLDVDFRALPSNKVVEVALLLPMSSDRGVANHNYLEFYQGFLMGLDSVKNINGHSVNVTLFDTKGDSIEVDNIVRSSEFLRANLIVGPIYERELTSVLRVAEQRAIPVVSPLANLSAISSDALFQMAAVPYTKYDKVVEALADTTKRITLIYTKNIDSDFELEIIPLLEGRDYAKYQYEYARGQDGATSTDLAPIFNGDAENLFVVMSSNEIEVDRILAGIASAHVNMKSRGQRPQNYTILGNARWNRFKNIDRTMFFKNNVTFLSTYHAKRDVTIIQGFDRSYINEFGSLPTLFSYRGYDAAMIFVPAMYGDIEYDMESKRYKPLQTTYIFGTDNEGKNHVNKNWSKITYNQDYTITVE